MVTWLVRCLPKGAATPIEDYRKVEAESAKEAAEKLCGQPLSEHGANDRLRAFVRLPRDKTNRPFYAP